MNRADAAGGGGGALTTARRESQESSRRRDVAGSATRQTWRDACNAGQFVDPSTGTKIFRRSADSSRAHCWRTPVPRRRDCDIMRVAPPRRRSSSSPSRGSFRVISSRSMARPLKRLKRSSRRQARGEEGINRDFRWTLSRSGGFDAARTARRTNGSRATAPFTACNVSGACYATYRECEATARIINQPQRARALGAQPAGVITAARGLCVVQRALLSLISLCRDARGPLNIAEPLSPDRGHRARLQHGVPEKAARRADEFSISGSQSAASTVNLRAA